MRQEIIQVIIAVCKQNFDVEMVVELDRPDEQFGDFSTNVAMKLARELNRNPREIAQEISRDLQKNELFKEVGVAGPGFINITLSDESLIILMKTEPAKPLNGMKVLVEYSDPNPFKPLHAGHLYTTIVGDVIARLVEQSGAKTTRINYGGDVGLHVAKSMWAIWKFTDGNLQVLADVPDVERPTWLGARYVEGNAAYEQDEHAKVEILEANKKVYSIHENDDHDSDFAQIYWTCRKWSYDYFDQLYEQLEVHTFDRFIPESEVTTIGLETVKEQIETGVYENSDGAVIFDGEKHGLHKRVFINSESLPTYETKDVGLSLTKWNDYHFDESIIITANEQAQYMQVVIKSIEQFEPEPAQRTKHLTHGFVKLAGGVKMSSRKGNVVTAMDIVEAANEVGQSSGKALDKAVVLAAIKYALLKNSIGGDIVYNPEESIAMEGNSGPYLQYAHARACSILRKSEQEPSQIDNIDDQERPIIRKIGEYAEVVDKASADLAPQNICSYLYELAQSFNRFYENAQVIGSDREAIRLSIVQNYSEILKKGLNLLGIQAPDKM